MRYKKKDIGECREVFLPESVTSIDKKNFLSLIENFIASKLETLIFDFEDTRIIDSACIGFILTARHLLNENNKKLILRNPKNYVKRTFDIMNFSHMFKINYS